MNLNKCDIFVQSVNLCNKNIIWNGLPKVKWKAKEFQIRKDVVFMMKIVCNQKEDILLIRNFTFLIPSLSRVSLARIEILLAPGKQATVIRPFMSILDAEGD